MAGQLRIVESCLRFQFVTLLLICGTTAGCAGMIGPTATLDYTDIRAEAPDRILTVATGDRDLRPAALLLRAAFEQAVAERGYLTIPTEASDTSLAWADDHLDLQLLRQRTACDSVLLISVQEWSPAEDGQHVAIGAAVTMNSCTSGRLLWQSELSTPVTRQPVSAAEKLGNAEAILSSRDGLEVPRATPTGSGTFNEIASGLTAISRAGQELLASLSEEDWNAAERYSLWVTMAPNAGLPYGPESRDYLDDVESKPAFPPDAPWRQVRLLGSKDPDPDAILLGPAEGISCRRHAGDIALEAIARRELRTNAASMGANVVFLDGCGAVGLDLAKNCWMKVVCSGQAARVGGHQ